MATPRPYNPRRPLWPLTPGTRLGAYEVTAQIGAGGMGEVYRAHDTKLGRDVALKVLPEAFAADADRVARFQREAKTLAALNHPHIAQIYGLEDIGAGGRALVMELVEGDDLSQRIARGPMPLDEALPIAKQIADALEAAHEQGIIHRDLKPANIKVRPDGTVKVLDFGLAKAMEPTGVASPSVSQSPTIPTPAMTQAGMILGTAAYMSPEQARGKPVDKRTDIWAFGCVLYEMLTGRVPLKAKASAIRETTQATAAMCAGAGGRVRDGCSADGRASGCGAVAPRRTRRCRGDHRERRDHRHAGVGRHAPGAASCLAPAGHALQGTAALTISGIDRITGDHAGRLPPRLRRQPRHATLRPRARRPRAGGGVHRRAARAVRLPRWAVDRVRRRPAAC